MTTSHVWMQTASGRAMDLLFPTPEMVDFEIDVPEHLARTGRFAGAVRDGIYSVAQHCVLGADYIHAETGRADLAAAFLLHDAHEAYIGDIITLVTQALATYVDQTGDRMRLVDLPDMREQIRALKQRLDRAIHAAASIPWPLPELTQKFVKSIDLRMLHTERDQLLGAVPMPWHAAVESAAPIPLRGKIKVWPWPQAADEYRVRFERYVTPARNPHLSPAA